MLLAWEGREKLPESLQYGTAWETHYRAWGAQIINLVRGSLAWVRGDVMHLYHGSRQNRRYGVLGTWGNGSSNQAKTAIVLGLPGGQFLVAAFGLGVIGVGAYHFYRVHQASFMQSYDTSAMSQTEKVWAERIGRFGLGCRGIVFLILGIFLVQAALQYDPSEVGGLGKALDSLSRRTYGAILFLIVALGFVAYGAYCFSRARYKQFVKHESR